MKKIITPEKKLFLPLKEIWEYRELFFFLSLRDIKLRYKHSFMAIFWALIPPIFLTFILTLSFGKVFISSLHIPYFIFALSGLIFWNYFFSAVNRISNSLLTNKSFITKIYFPKILIPLSSIMVSIVDFLLTLICFVLLLVLFHIPISFTSVLICIIGLFITTLFALAIGIIFSVLNVFYKDTREILPLFTTFLFFLTPVIYPTRSILQPYNQWLYINPLTGIIETIRISLFSKESIFSQHLLEAFIISIFLFCTSAIYFLAKESEITDIL